MGKKNEPWSERWDLKKRLSQGGQGITFMAARKGDSEPNFVLKKLRQPQEKERRERMYREVVALETLKHDQIAKYEDSNARAWSTQDDLYVVTRFVDGPHPTKQPDVETAATILLHLLDPLEYCHKKEIVHRDLKPANVIIRGDNPEDPVILDFGLSFNAKRDPQDHSTKIGQHLGPSNFFRLPELQGGSLNKHSPRSDITLCVGLLFYMITGIDPVSSLDEHSKMPHEREKAKAVLQAIPSGLRPGIARIFDVGFRQEIDERWPSISALRQVLQPLALGQAGLDPSIEEQIQTFRKQFVSAPARRFREQRALQIEAFLGRANVIEKWFQGQLSATLNCTMQYVQKEPDEYILYFLFKDKVRPTLGVVEVIAVQFSGEIIIRGTSLSLDEVGNIPQSASAGQLGFDLLPELARVPLFDSKAEDVLDAEAKRLVIEALKDLQQRGTE